MKDYAVPADKIAADIDQWITGRNAKRNREILKMSLIDGIPYEDIAEAFQMSSAQIARIVPRARAKLFRHVDYPIDNS